MILINLDIEAIKIIALETTIIIIIITEEEAKTMEAIEEIIITEIMAIEVDIIITTKIEELIHKMKLETTTTITEVDIEEVIKEVAIEITKTIVTIIKEVVIIMDIETTTKMDGKETMETTELEVDINNIEKKTITINKEIIIDRIDMKNNSLKVKKQTLLTPPNNDQL
jgi:hypothetical protein